MQTDSSGFRLRGLDTTRIETFTDAAFAFAMTLLVIAMAPTTSYEGLLVAFRNIPTFVLSGTLLMMFWWGHHEWSRRYGLDDGVTTVLSCLLVFTVLIYVYPLRFLFGTTTAWLARMTGLPLGPADFPGLTPLQVNDIFAFYGLGFVAMCGALVLLYVHAWRCRKELELDELERLETIGNGGAWGIVGAVGLLSSIVALVVPPSWAGVPGWIYMLLPVLMPLYSRAMGRRSRAARERRSGRVGHAVTPQVEGAGV